MLGSLSEDWTGGGTEDNWSPYDVIGHLIHGEITDWIPRARIIIEHGASRCYPLRPAGEFENSKGKTLAQLLDEFETLRRENLAELRGMDITPENSP